ncbi:MAG: chromate transporter [Lachnospiraceae bacterium]|nr:chromate transporter [Lachnospiraceae bacterium]
MIYLELFWSFFQIGLFSIGGGYAAMPLIQHQVTEVHSWINMTQFADIVTIAEMTPGPVAINSATFVGTLVAGLPGAIAATLGCVTPSCAIVMTLAYFYYRFREMNFVQGLLSGGRPAVIAMIASAGISLFFTAVCGNSSLSDSQSGINARAVVIFIGAFLILRKWKISPIWAMLGSGAVGLVLFSLP